MVPVRDAVMGSGFGTEPVEVSASPEAPLPRIVSIEYLVFTMWTLQSGSLNIIQQKIDRWFESFWPDDHLANCVSLCVTWLLGFTLKLHCYFLCVCVFRQVIESGEGREANTVRVGDKLTFKIAIPDKWVAFQRSKNAVTDVDLRSPSWHQFFRLLLPASSRLFAAHLTEFSLEAAMRWPRTHARHSK